MYLLLSLLPSSYSCSIPTVVSWPGNVPPCDKQHQVLLTDTAQQIHQMGPVSQQDCTMPKQRHTYKEGHYAMSDISVISTKGPNVWLHLPSQNTPTHGQRIFSIAVFDKSWGLWTTMKICHNIVNVGVCWRLQEFWHPLDLWQEKMCQHKGLHGGYSIQELSDTSSLRDTSSKRAYET